MLLVLVQIRVHPGSLPPHGPGEVESGEQIGLPTALIAISGVAGGQNVVLLRDDRQGQVVRQRERLAGGSDGQLSGMREQCRRLLPAGPLEISATAWAVTCQLPAPEGRS